MPLKKAERLELIFDGLGGMRTASSRNEALQFIQDVFKKIEDAHSGVPDIPDHPKRLHPPTEDMEEDVPGKSTVKSYRHKRHYTLIADNGAFQICKIVKEEKQIIVFDKKGADGKGVP